MLTLLRLLGRFCCVSLEKNWSSKLKNQIEDLLHDEDETIQNVRKLTYQSSTFFF